MRVHLGSDHAGLDLKDHLLSWLRENGHEPVDHGPFHFDAVDDYPVFCLRAAEGVAKDPGSIGVVIGGSGNGEQMAANKVAGVRAALVWNADIAVLAREHNDANVISVGGRMHTVEEMTHFVDVFIRTPFSGDERHRRRIAMMADYETTRELPPLPESARSPEGTAPDA
ncbi:MAG TPA: ribose-5-phosphate isomerase [Marmoricola sp.]